MKKKYFYLLLISLVFNSVAQSQNYREIIKEYFTENYQQLDLLEEDVRDWIITNEVYSKKSEVSHIYVQQTYNGIPIFNAVANFAIKNNKIVHSNTSFIKETRAKRNTETPVLTPNVAIDRAAYNLNLGAASKIELLENIGLNEYLYSTSGISQEKIPVSLVYQPMEDNEKLMLAWNLSVYQMDSKHWWNVRIDALSGTILNKNDYQVSCNFDHNHSDDSEGSPHKEINSKPLLYKKQSILSTGEQYNVFAIPVESPNHGARTVLTDPQDSEASPFGWHDIDGVAGAEYTYTRGNNVYAQEDTDGSDGTFGYAPDGTSTLNFNFELDLNQQPSGYQDASLTNLFYMNNIMHDVWFHYGFDPSSGSFQTDNYEARAGDEGDPVIADGQDGSGFNNANFGTPPDGSSPRMQMFLWSPGPAELLTINSGSLAGGYLGLDSNYGGPALSTTPITSDLVLADDGISPSDDACTALTNGADISGKIAVIKRGDCNFTVKVQFAQDVGAIAVIMVTDDREVIAMGGTSTTITIPAIMISEAEGDAIIASLNNGDTINATMAAPEENYNIDASLDNVIIAHEYGHGISNRIIGGPDNTSCMNNTEQLGEGWSDFFGIMLTMKSSDTEDLGRGVATYSNGEGVDGTGIRQYKYSPDMSVNPFTLEDVEDQWFTNSSGQPQVSVHGIGSIWATMLWDLNWKMIAAYGFDPDFYKGTGGNNMTMHLVIEGLKLTPCSSGLQEARDAILAADDALYGGANKCLIWQVFSRRGLGYSASSGSANSYTDQTAAYDMPPESELGGASCTLQVNKEKIDLFNIYPNPSNGLISINGIGINEDVSISIFDVNGREVYSEKVNLNGNTSINAKGLTTGFYILKIQGDEFTHNEKIIIE